MISLPISPSGPVKRRVSAFTILELLTVIGIMALVSVASMPAVSALTKSSKINQAMSQITSTLEQARQYAVANNTYTWVAFYQDSTAQEGSEVYVATLGSRDGTDPTDGFTTGGNVDMSRVIPLNRNASFAQVQLKQPGANSWPALPSVTASQLAGNVTFRINIPGKGETSFDQVIQFTPAGEARVSPGLPSVIELGLRPELGGNVADANNIAVIRVAGMTGQTRLFRP
jgi:Tfp pilus assembly protein FimT